MLTPGIWGPWCYIQSGNARKNSTDPKTQQIPAALRIGIPPGGVWPRQLHRLRYVHLGCGIPWLPRVWRRKKWRPWRAKNQGPTHKNQRFSKLFLYICSMIVWLFFYGSQAIHLADVSVMKPIIYIMPHKPTSPGSIIIYILMPSGPQLRESSFRGFSSSRAQPGFEWWYATAIRAKGTIAIASFLQTLAVPSGAVTELTWSGWVPGSFSLRDRTAYIHAYTRIHTCLYDDIYMCTYMYICMYICMYIIL